ncbi:hypothetical protein DWY75_05565 [Ruminococcus sp. AF27-11AA]|nr:hypothetical protein DWY75_05565 [Ruminococcus sp. AF27-11AA]
MQNKMQIKTRGSDSFWSFILHKMCPKNTIFNKNTECPLFFLSEILETVKKMRYDKKRFLHFGRMS